MASPGRRGCRASRAVANCRRHNWRNECGAGDGDHWQLCRCCCVGHEQSGRPPCPGRQQVRWGVGRGATARPGKGRRACGGWRLGAGARQSQATAEPLCSSAGKGNGCGDQERSGGSWGSGRGGGCAQASAAVQLAAARRRRSSSGGGGGGGRCCCRCWCWRGWCCGSERGGCCRWRNLHRRVCQPRLALRRAGGERCGISHGTRRLQERILRPTHRQSQQHIPSSCGIKGREGEAKPRQSHRQSCQGSYRRIKQRHCRGDSGERLGAGERRLCRRGRRPRVVAQPQAELGPVRRGPAYDGRGWSDCGRRCGGRASCGGGRASCGGVRGGGRGCSGLALPSSGQRGQASR